CSGRGVKKVLAGLSKRVSPAYASQHYRAWQQGFRWLRQAQLIAHNPLEGVRPPQDPDKPVSVITDQQLRALLLTCRRPRFEGRRDRAMIRVLVDTGVRASEIVGLRVADVDLGTRSLLVLGKGGRPRIVPVGAKTAEAISRY